MTELIPPIPQEIGPDYLKLCEESVAQARKITETATIQLALQRKSKEDIQKRCKELGLDVDNLEAAKTAALKSVSKAKKDLDEALTKFFEVADASKD